MGVSEIGPEPKIVTDRGFRIFLNANPVRVLESSLAFRGPHVRIFQAPDEGVHLSVEEAEAVAKALLVFVTEARADELTEPMERDG